MTTELPEAYHDPKGNLLRPAQMAEHEHEIKMCKSQLDNPLIQEKGEVRKRLSALERQYHNQAPVQLDGATRDKLAKENAQLMSEIQPVLLTQEEMRKNPAGSVDRYNRGENSPAMKAKILRWKKNQLMLNADGSRPSTWDRDAANLERFRPSGQLDHFRSDAQISGHMSYGNVPDSNWVQTFGTTRPQVKTPAASTPPQATDEVKGAGKK